MRHLVRQPPMPPMPGWGPLTHPQPRQGAGNVLILKTVREVALFGAGTAVAAWTGRFAGGAVVLAYLLGRGLFTALRWCWANGRSGEVGRALVAGALIAFLAVLAVGAPGAPAKAKPKPKAVKVEAAQADQLEHARNVWSQVWKQVETAYSEAKKEGAR